MVKYIVKWKYDDPYGIVQKCSQEFTSYKEANYFYNHIVSMTRELVNEYGFNGCYSPFKNIELTSKEVKDDR